MPELTPELPSVASACGGPSLAVLRSLETGELHGAELVRVQGHTTSCERCQAVLSDFTADRAALRTMLPFMALEARLIRTRRPAWRRWLLGGTGALAAVTAALLMLPRHH